MEEAKKLTWEQKVERVWIQVVGLVTGSWEVHLAVWFSVHYHVQLSLIEGFRSVEEGNREATGGKHT